MLILEIAVVILIVFVSLAGFLISNLWFNIGFLAIQFGCIAFLISSHLSVTFTIILFFSGLVVIIILGMTTINFNLAEPRPLPKTRTNREIPLLFPLLGSLIILLFVYSSLGRMDNWIPTLNAQQSAAALVLVSLNIFKLAIIANMSQSIHALISIFQGFEILITALTFSLVAVGLLAISTLVIALVCAYLLVSASFTET